MRFATERLNIIGGGRRPVLDRLLHRTSRVHPENVYPYGDKWPFGVTIAGNKVTIYNIEVQIGDSTPKTLADTTVTIANDNEYVYFTCPWTSGIITIGVTQTASDFYVTGTQYADFILQCRLSGTAAALKRWGCAGQRQKHPGNFGQL